MVNFFGDLKKKKSVERGMSTKIHFWIFRTTRNHRGIRNISIKNCQLPLLNYTKFTNAGWHGEEVFGGKLMRMKMKNVDLDRVAAWIPKARALKLSSHLL